MKKLGILVSVMLVIAAGVCSAATTAELEKENAELKQRLDKVERELAEIKAMLAGAEKAPAPEKPTPPAAPEKKPVTSGLDIQLYGYIKTDASYDTDRVNTGNYVLWVDRQNTNNNDDDEFNMTANQTRLGMNITGPQIDGMNTAGRVEIDFYGSGGTENKPSVLVRHAYMNFDWPDQEFSIIAGQTSDVISPLYPSTLNYTVLWDVGNIGYRRPQIRLTKGTSLSGDTSMNFEGAVTRTIADDALIGSEHGEDAGYPSLQGRTSITFPWFGPKPTTVGFSGHWGREEFDEESKKFETWSVNMDVLQPVNNWLTLRGEWFCGQNLDQYFGGIGQGINTTTFKEIDSTGGWVAATMGPWDKWSFNLGSGVDDPDSGDLSDGGRSRNYAVFGNVLYAINSNAQVGLELSHWRTKYKGSGDAEDVRAQTSFIYSF